MSYLVSSSSEGETKDYLRQGKIRAGKDLNVPNSSSLPEAKKINENPVPPVDDAHK